MRIRRQRRARLSGGTWFVDGTQLVYAGTSPMITIDPAFSYGDYTYTTTMPITKGVVMSNGDNGLSDASCLTTSLGVISSAHTNPV